MSSVSEVMPEMSGSKVEVLIPSRLGFEKVAMSTAAAMAKLMGFSEDRVDDLKTAVAEACINAIEHGNHMNATIPVGVVLSILPGELEVRVLDDGNGMHTKPNKPDIDKKMTGEEDARGMGMFLIQALVDEVEWVPKSKGQSFVRLVIRINPETENPDLKQESE
jgi:serine/threonine-protein kinase RsbW